MMIRKKARILVHPDYAATLVGTPDQTGLLKEGEVFLQVGGVPSWQQEVSKHAVQMETLLRSHHAWLWQQIALLRDACHVQLDPA
jgi:hypothetical protein